MTLICGSTLVNPKVGILNVNLGNCFAVDGALRRLGIEPVMVKSPKELSTISHLIIPGVGKMSYFISQLKDLKMDKEIKAYGSCGYILGICLGFQSLFQYSHEGHTECLGILDGIIQPIPTISELSTNVGYAKIEINNDCHFSQRIDFCQLARYYFVHSYYLPKGANSLYLTSVGSSYITAFVSNGYNIFGTQFHPELSHSSGRQLLKSFIELS